MSLTRREIIALLGGAAAAPAIGVKEAAKAMGAEGLLSVNEPFPTPVSGSGWDELDRSQRWWKSLQYRATEASREARNDYEQTRYAHVKSWGAGFRHSVIRREIMVEHLFQRKMEQDEEFQKKVLGILLP